VVLVALTGWGQEEDKRRSHEAGFDSHLVKPIEPATLERLLAGLNSAKA
jgi:CheY-like chemotaxis protein